MKNNSYLAGNINKLSVSLAANIKDLNTCIQNIVHQKMKEKIIYFETY